MSLSICISTPAYINVTTAGTPVPLGAGVVTGAASILITARQNKTTANTGDIYLGDRAAQNQVLEAGQALAIELDDNEKLDLANLRLDAANNGDGVSLLIKQH
jgi:hypothetical protein